MRIRTYGGVRGLSYNSPYSIKRHEPKEWNPAHVVE